MFSDRFNKLSGIVNAQTRSVLITAKAEYYGLLNDNELANSLARNLRSYGWQVTYLTASKQGGTGNVYNIVCQAEVYTNYTLSQIIANFKNQISFVVTNVKAVFLTQPTTTQPTTNANNESNFHFQATSIFDSSIIGGDKDLRDEHAKFNQKVRSTFKNGFTAYSNASLFARSWVSASGITTLSASATKAKLIQLLQESGFVLTNITTIEYDQNGVSSGGYLTLPNTVANPNVITPSTAQTPNADQKDIEGFIKSLGLSYSALAIIGVGLLIILRR